jgi:hypothetical protein
MLFLFLKSENEIANNAPKQVGVSNWQFLVMGVSFVNKIPHRGLGGPHPAQTKFR